MFSENTGLYFYSALIQSNAALIAIVGIFVIYKLQSLQNMIDSMPNKMLSVFKGAITPSDITEFDMGNKDKRQQMIDRKMSDERGGGKKIGRFYMRWDNMINDIIPTKRIVQLPMALTGIGIIIYSVLLLTVKTIHCYLANIELLIYSLAVLYQIIIISLIFKAVKDLVFAEYDGK